MKNPFAGSTEHSAEYFGDSRDFWWNRDYLLLVAQRLGLHHVKSILDVGCGVGHWGQNLVSIIQGNGSLTGVDAEARWVEEARKRVNLQGWQIDYKPAAAESLPFPNDNFDLVTCQTVLIHVPDPRVVLQEMLRVLKPGGLILLAEPNNAVAPMFADLIATNASHDEKVQLLDFHLRCLEGKRRLGRGDESIGEKLPGLLTSLGAQNISASLNDRVPFLTPPYEEPGQRALVEEALSWVDRDFFVWSRVETEKFFRAGDGTMAEFNRYWDLAKQIQFRVRDLMEAKTYTAAGAALFYLVAGRKPSN